MQIPSEAAAVLLAVGTAVIALFSKWLLGKITKLNSKIQSPIVENLVRELNEKYIPEAVSFANQTFVEKLKQSGEWDDTKEMYQTNSAKALNTSYDALMSVMPAFFTKTVSKYFTDMPATLKTHIETYINKQKQIKNYKTEEITL